MMKKLLSLVLGLLMLPLLTEASSSSQVITLSPGWNAVSTPAYLSNLTFSNEGEGISFTTLKDGSWISVSATVDNIKPLDGFMVYNSNSSTVTLTLDYKENPDPSESIWQKTLSRGWNLLGITTTNDPFNGIDATMYVDPTVGGRYTVSNGITNPELGEAYFVFVSDGSIYGGVNNSSNDQNEIGLGGEEEIIDNETGGQNDSDISNNILDINFIVYMSPVYRQGELKFKNKQNTIVAEFDIMSSTNVDQFLLDTFTLELLSGNGINDISDIDIQIGGESIDLNKINIDNGIITVEGINKNINKGGTYITVIKKEEPGIGQIVYKLSSLNGVSKKIEFITTILQ